MLATARVSPPSPAKNSTKRTSSKCACFVAKSVAGCSVDAVVVDTTSGAFNGAALKTAAVPRPATARAPLHFVGSVALPLPPFMFLPWFLPLFLWPFTSVKTIKKEKEREREVKTPVLMF